MSIASAYIEERIHPSDRNAIDLAIRDYGGFRITKEDWCRYGDRNALCRRIERAWISKGATPLDVSAMEISGIAGFEVLPQDLISHALEFQDGKSWEYASPRARELRDRFEILTSRKLDLRSARSLFEAELHRERLASDDCPF